MPIVPLWPGVPPLLHAECATERPTLTIITPDGPGPFPAVVVCPGGGYGGRAGHEAEPIARWLAGLGIAGLVVAYRVAPHRHPVPLMDAQRAIRLARANAAAWKLDPARVGVLGFSAGGHLAASCATCFDDGLAGDPDPVQRLSSRPDAAVLCYPVISFGAWRHQGSMANLLGTGNPTAAQRQAFSLETRVSDRTPPCFIWHTADDEAVPVQNALLFAGALADRQIPFALHVHPSGQHGLGLAEGHPAGAWTTAAAAWFAGLGWR